MGMEPTMPYLSPSLEGEQLLVGANFASAGVGILNDTGFQFVSTYIASILLFLSLVVSQVNALEFGHKYFYLKICLPNQAKNIQLLPLKLLALKK